jgi:CRP/FNR family transcriptional regulator
MFAESPTLRVVPAAGDAHAPISLQPSDGAAEAACGTVRFSELAGLLGAVLPAEPAVADLAFPVRRLKAGDTLLRAGDRFNAIYVVRSGFLKTVSIDPTGAELVLGFPMGGDVIGLDGVDSGHYTADVTALDMTTVAAIPFARLAQLGHEHQGVERLLYSLFSRELGQRRTIAWLLGALSAEARVASFLLDLADRYARLGYSRTSFMVRMTRQEMGSYLGLKLETVSRMFSSFAAAGLIEVDAKSVKLLDADGLRRIVEPPVEERPRRRPSPRQAAPDVRFPRPRLGPLSLVAA